MQAIEMLPVFPKRAEPGDTLKLMRKQRRVIGQELNQRLRQITAPLRRA